MRIVERVEWKTNEWETSSRPIKVRDLVALAWIPLSVLNEHELLPTRTENGSVLNLSVRPQNIYRNKGELSKLFDKLMEHRDVSKLKGGPQYTLNNESVESAFEVLGKLPELYDYIFSHLGDAYNAETNGKFGKIKAVKNPRRGKIRSPFYQNECDYGVPDGFVLPILYGLKALLVVKNKRVEWKSDPYEFIEANLPALAGAFKLPMEMAGFDPQKIAKSENSYGFMVGEVEKALIKLDAAA